MEPRVSCIYLTYIVWNICENLHYQSVYFKELHNEQEYYRPTIYRAETAVVSTVTSINCALLYRYIKSESHKFCYS